MIHDINEGLGEDAKVKALVAHRGCKSTYQKLAELRMVEDVKEYIKNSQNCKQQGNFFKRLAQNGKVYPVR